MCLPPVKKDKLNLSKLLNINPLKKDNIIIKPDNIILPTHTELEVKNNNKKMCYQAQFYNDIFFIFNNKNKKKLKKDNKIINIIKSLIIN